mmetsp:Transcript_10134/g.30702  ORF Transcript_10134/g.30702 Transcript_10134/m.30702 type:complete len:248 (+) Transcript_10134:83-826(+)
MRFAGKNVVVTGGTSGIGLAAATRALKEGATNVLVTGTKTEGLEAAEKAGLIAVKNDAGKPEDAEALAAAVKEKLGGEVHALFLNAGFGHFQATTEATAAEFDLMFNVNVKGPLMEMRALAPLLVDGASVCFNTSVVQDMGMPGAAVYSATKGALRAMVRVMCKEFAPRKIRVNAVSPGVTASNFFAAAGMDEESAKGMQAAMETQIPLGRVGSADEPAAVALFLLSDDASYVTGSEFKVDGGLTEV